MHERRWASPACPTLHLDSALQDARSASSAEAPAPTVSASIPWTEQFDFDGDGRADRIHPSFTGGAHCCYRIAVELTSLGETVALPFQLDGGYVGGLDLSAPAHFDVKKLEGHSLPELLMEIETYNGVPKELPPEWRRRFGIVSHHVAVGFPNGKTVVRDLR